MRLDSFVVNNADLTDDDEHCEFDGNHKVQEKGTPKESPKQQNCKCCRLGLIEPVHGR